MKINEDGVSAADLKFGALIDRHEEEEMPERYSTRAAYRSNLDAHIKPRRADIPLASVKAVAVASFWHLEKSLTTLSSCAIITMRGGAVW